MTEEEARKYVEMLPRVFIRAVRDPPFGDESYEYELTEGQATTLLRQRERAAILAFIGGLDEEELAQAVREARDRHHREPGDLWYDSDEASAVLTHLKSKVET